jgi:hypothetical protein
MIKIIYEKYEGELNIETNEVCFYQKKFKNIFEAMEYFKKIEIEKEVFFNMNLFLE